MSPLIFSLFPSLTSIFPNVCFSPSKKVFSPFLGEFREEGATLDLRLLYELIILFIVIMGWGTLIWEILDPSHPSFFLSPPDPLCQSSSSFLPSIHPLFVRALTFSLPSVSRYINQLIFIFPYLCCLVYEAISEMREIITVHYPTHYLRFVVKSSAKVEQFQGIIPHDFCALEYVLMIEMEHVVPLWSYFTASNNNKKH